MPTDAVHEYHTRRGPRWKVRLKFYDPASGTWKPKEWAGFHTNEVEKDEMDY